MASRRHRHHETHDCDYLYLVGDIVDFWNLRDAPYWPQAHSDVIRTVLSKARTGTVVTLIPGNHDEYLRRFCDLQLGNIVVVSEAVREHRRLGRDLYRARRARGRPPGAAHRRRHLRTATPGTPGRRVIWALAATAVLLGLERATYVAIARWPAWFQSACAKRPLARLGEPVVVVESLFYAFRET